MVDARDLKSLGPKGLCRFESGRPHHPSGRRDTSHEGRDVAWKDVTWKDVTWKDVTWKDVTWKDVTWKDVK